MIYTLQQFPEDREVVMWAEKGYWNYDAADYIAGLFEVNTLFNSLTDKDFNNNFLVVSDQPSTSWGKSIGDWGNS